MIHTFIIIEKNQTTNEVIVHDTGFYELEEAQDYLAKLLKQYYNKYEKTVFKKDDKTYTIKKVRIIWEKGMPYV